MNLVRRMATTRIQDDDRVCTRGLEIIDDECCRSRKQVIDSTVQRILDEQDRSSDPEELAKIYKQITAPQVTKAKLTASNDEKEAKSYHKEHGSIKPKKRYVPKLKVKALRFNLFSKSHLAHTKPIKKWK